MDPFTSHAQINVIEKKKFVFGPKVPLPGSEMSLTLDACFRDFHKILNNFFVIIRYKECQKN